MQGHREAATELGSEADGDLRSRLVAAHLDRVYRFLWAFTGDRDLAEDLTQQTFLGLLRALAPAATALPSVGYVLRAARNAAVSRFRRLRLERRHGAALEPAALTVADGAPDPERAALDGERRRALRRALAGLGDEARAVLLLTEVEGLSYAEIGAILGCPPGTVGSRKHHAIRRLRQELERTGHGL